MKRVIAKCWRSSVWAPVLFAAVPALVAPYGGNAAAPERAPAPDTTERTSSATTFYEPGAPGPFDVGVMTLEVDVRTRREPVDTLVWYPATTSPGASPYVYNPQGGTPMVGEAVLEAPMADGGPFPAVVFSHGYGAINYQSIFLTEHLASHGYVVIAPNHPGNNLTDLKPGALWTGFILRPLDIHGMIDELERLDASDPRFQGRIDLEKIGMTGHSFGGYTTLAIAGARLNLDYLTERCVSGRDQQACVVVGEAGRVLGKWNGLIDLSDPRVTAAVPLAPLAWSPFQEEGLSYIDVPIQVHGGDRDHVVPAETDAAMVWLYAQEPKSFLEMYDAGHFTYSDICMMAPRFVQCRPPFIDMDLAHEIINTYVTSHFKVFLDFDMRYAGYLMAPYAEQWSDYAAWYEALDL